MKTLRMNLTLESVPVELVGKDGKVKKYKLVEMDGEKRGKYTNESSTLFEMSENGSIKKILSYEKMDVLLLSFCLYDEKDELVKIEELFTYPSRVLEELKKEARRLNGFDESREEVKNG